MGNPVGTGPAPIIEPYTEPDPKKPWKDWQGLGLAGRYGAKELVEETLSTFSEHIGQHQGPNNLDGKDPPWSDWVIERLDGPLDENGEGQKYPGGFTSNDKTRLENLLNEYKRTPVHLAGGLSAVSTSMASENADDEDAFGA